MTASVQDVATQLGRPIDDPLEINQITAWLELADMTIRSRCPNLDQLIASGRSRSIHHHPGRKKEAMNEERHRKKRNQVERLKRQRDKLATQNAAMRIALANITTILLDTSKEVKQ